LDFGFNERKNMNSLKTTKGEIPFPAYIPVTTYGSKYPLDKLIQPYLPRLASAVMVSHYYAQEMTIKPRIPLMIDSGGFASLFENAKVEERQGFGIITVTNDGKEETIDPISVLDRQEEIAEVGFTLDFPIPPGSSAKEAEKRMNLTLGNAKWALDNRRRQDLILFACIQSPNPANARCVASELAKLPFDGFALGGMVPRMRNWELVEEFVKVVLEEVGDRPLHVFGIGNPKRVRQLFEMGVSSVDSSSYVKAAADGICWWGEQRKVENPGTFDRVNLALRNLVAWKTNVMPLSYVQNAGINKQF
jgi:helicase